MRVSEKPLNRCTGAGAEVYRSQLKMIRRKKGKSLTDLAMEIRKLMVMAFPGSQDSTTEVIAWTRWKTLN